MKVKVVINGKIVEKPEFLAEILIRKGKATAVGADEGEIIPDEIPEVNPDEGNEATEPANEVPESKPAENPEASSEKAGPITADEKVKLAKSAIKKPAKKAGKSVKSVKKTVIRKAKK